jgi:signal transduction histidine kinase
MSFTKFIYKQLKENLFFSYKSTALVTLLVSVINIVFWQIHYTDNVITGYTINPKATMKAITSVGFLLLAFSYFTKNKKSIKILIVSGILLQCIQFAVGCLKITNLPSLNLSSAVTSVMFILSFLAIYFIKVKRIRIVFLILNSILYLLASFSVFYYLLDMNELVKFIGFETLSWNAAILFFMNSISLFEYKLITRIDTLNIKEILIKETHPYKYYPFFFLIPILITTIVSILAYFKLITIIVAAFLIILFLSASSFINMFLYSNNFIRFYIEITNKANELEETNRELSRLNKKLSMLNKKVNHKNAYLEDFAAITSHNLREPIVALDELNKITNYITTETGLRENELKEMYNSSIERLTQGIDNLIEYHNFIKNEDEIKKKSTWLSNSINETFKTLEHLKPKDTTITIDIAEDILLTKNYIENILRNLITNSFKYKKENIPLEIKIVAYKTAGNYKILFRDNGIGIDLIKNKFNLFKKAKRFHEKSKTSNGYGLYYTKLYVEKLKGTIAIYSSPHKGTAFRIQIKVSK